MKKYLVVLLIAVLAISSAFAADPTITGSISAKATWNFDDETFEYGIDDAHGAYLCVSDYFSLAKKGEAVPYVDLSVYVTYLPGSDAVYADTIGYTGSYLTVEDFTFGIDTFKIVGDKWVLDFNPWYYTTDFATDVIDSSYASISKDGKSYSMVPLSYKWATDYSVYDSNIAFTYDGIGTLVVNGDTDHTNESNFAAFFNSAEQTFDDITAQAAFGYSVVKNEVNDTATNQFGVSLKAAYKDIVSVASDMGVTKVTSEDAKFDADVALHVAYAPVTLDAYYATKASATYYKNALYANQTTTPVSKDLVSIKTVFDFAEDYGTTLTVKLQDVAHDERKISAEIENTSLDKHTFTFAVNDMSHKATKDGTGLNVEFDAAVEVSEELSAYVGLDAYLADGAYPAVEFGGSFEKGAYAVALDATVQTGEDKFEDAVEFSFAASYTAEKFVASVSLDYNNQYNTTKEVNKITNQKEKQYTSMGTWASCSEYEGGLLLDVALESDVIVDGATLKLEWKTEDLTEKDNFGKLTASCKVEF